MTEIRSMLKAQCVSPLGTGRVDEMAFQTDAARLCELHQQVGELTRILEEEDSFPDQGFYDVRPSLHRIRIEGTYMEADEMFSLKCSLENIGQKKKECKDVIALKANRHRHPSYGNHNEERL